MDTKTCIETRRSVRRYLDKPVDRALISEIVAAAQMAPSWKNSQTVRFVFIDNAELKKKIAENAVMGFAKNADVLISAPAMMLVTTVHGVSGFEADGSFSTSKGAHWESFDAGLATQTLCLALHEAGLGSCIMGIFDAEKVAELAELPADQRVSCIMPIGYPAEGKHGKLLRKPLEEVLSFR